MTEPVLRRHADHDPDLICRPALGYGLCEVLDDLARQDMRSIMWGCPPGCAETHTRPHVVLGDEERSEEKNGTVTAYADRALDWPVDYWASSDWDRNTSTEFVCAHYESRSRPDRRCKTGIRTWHEPCHHVFPDWETLRELLVAVAAHIAEAHSDAGVERSETARTREAR